MTTLKPQILIVDDHPVMRRGLAQLIQLQPDLEVCGEAAGVGDALELLKTVKPDLMIIDMSLNDGHGLELIKDLRKQADPPKMLVVSMHDEAAYAERALRAGAHGYVSKAEAVEKIVDAIRQVLKGELYLNPAMTARLLNGMVGGGPRKPGTPDEVLSDRELQVFELLGQGISSREISTRLTLSVKTIDTYREHIKDKLGLKSGNELVLRAVLWAHERR